MAEWRETLLFEGKEYIIVFTTSFAPYSFFIFSNIKTLAESEEEFNQDSKDEIQEAISWYNRILGFHIEGGHGN